MANRAYNVGLIALVAMLTISPAFVAGCANNPSLYEELASKPPLDSKNVKADGGDSVFQQDGVLVVDGMTCGSIKEWVTTDGKTCTPRPEMTMTEQFGTMAAALEMSESFDLSMDCSGNCGPAGIFWCCVGDECTYKGAKYEGRFVCAPLLDDLGKCHMKAVPFACPAGEYCELNGIYPVWAQCLQCKSNADCDDENVCTDDTCNLASGQCSHLNNVASCDDGNKCNGTEMCASGVCKGGAVPNCDDGKLCTTDSCVPTTGCANAANTLACDDGNACTIGDKCLDKACSPGTNPECTDDNACTADSCDTATGCKYTNLPASTGCNDSNLCTINDACDGAGKCGGTAKSCGDANVCTEDTCNPETGSCVNFNLANGTACGTGKQCVMGTCYDLADTCTVKGQGVCKTKESVLGHYTCTIGTGEVIGTWTLDEVCGAIATKTACADDIGCTSPTSTEAACNDGVDNDADTKTDCADPDCAASSFCAACVPACTGKTCGSDGCGGSCGTCAAGTSCNTSGACVAPCVPSCTGKTCGADGCGGTCGTCAAGQACNNGACAAPAGNGIGFVAKAADADVHCWDLAGNHIGKFAVATGDAFTCPNAANGSAAVAVTTTEAACDSCLNASLAYGPCHALSGGGYGCQL